MRLKDWLYDKRVYFIIHTLTTIMIVLFMKVFQMNTESSIFVAGILIVGHLSYLFYEYFRRFRFYDRIEKQARDLDQKFLLHEFVGEAHFYEGDFLYNMLYEGNKAMNDEIQKYKLEQKDYAEYIETWVHEVKTPLAASNLIIENNISETTKSLGEELKKVEAYVEQALYYAKSNHLEKDYIIKEVYLEAIVQKTLKKHSKVLIAKRCKIELDSLDLCVKSDEKWLKFILEQIINNAIQYSDQQMTLKIYASSNESQVSLVIEDHGIGIAEEDLNRVFEKGFTGINGRGRKSTGIGLYLCYKLANKMGLRLEITSEQHKYTKVFIHFPRVDLY